MTRRVTYALLGLTALAAAIRFGTLDLQSYHHDEAVTAGKVIDPNLGDTLSQVADGERSPPLYYLLAWLWSKLFGTGEVGLRSLSALTGTLMVPAAFYAARRLAGDGAGLAAAVLFALNPYLVWYSQEARSYILMTLFVVLAVGYLVAYEREGERRHLWLWAGASALALLSHYFAAFVIVPEVAWLIGSRTERRTLAAPTLALAAVGIALVPLALSQQGDDRRDGFADRPVAERAAEVGLNYVASEDPDPLAGGRNVDLVQVGAGVGGLFLFAAGGWIVFARMARRDRDAPLKLAGLSAVVIALPTLLAFGGLDLLNPRNLIAALVPLLLAGAIAFSRSDRVARLGLAAAAAMFGAVVFAFNVSAEMQREDWRGVADAMGSAEGNRIVVTLKNGDDPLEYYLGATKFDGGRFENGVDVKEVDVVTTGGPFRTPDGFTQAHEVPRPPLFDLVVFRSDKPVSVKPGDFDDVVPFRFEVLIDRP